MNRMYLRRFCNCVYATSLLLCAGAGLMLYANPARGADDSKPAEQAAAAEGEVPAGDGEEKAGSKSKSKKDRAEAGASEADGEADSAKPSASSKETEARRGARAGVCPVSNAEEIKVLLRLRERHTVLLAQESMVAQREAQLNRLEKDFEAKLAQLEVGMAKIEQRLLLGDAKQKQHEQRLVALVDTISKLSAKKAAPMLAAAEPEVVAELFRRLGAQRTSSLLAVMPPAKAGKLIDYAADVIAKEPAAAASAP